MKNKCVLPNVLHCLITFMSVSFEIRGIFDIHMYKVTKQGC